MKEEWLIENNKIRTKENKKLQKEIDEIVSQLKKAISKGEDYTKIYFTKESTYIKSIKKMKIMRCIWAYLGSDHIFITINKTRIKRLEKYIKKHSI